MGEVVNLRRARKAKARLAEETGAAAKRAHHGTPKPLRDASKKEKARAEHLIGAHRLDRSDETS